MVRGCSSTPSWSASAAAASLADHPGVEDELCAPHVFTFGHVRQLDSVAASVLVELAQRTPLLTAADQIAFLDLDDTIRATHGYAKQGAGYGYSKVKGLNALLATVSSASAAPVIVATRLRKGSASSARGAARLVADSLKTTRACGVSGTVILRADSAYYGRDIVAAARRGGAHFWHYCPQGPRRHRRHLRDSRGWLDQDPLPPRDL